MSEVKIRKSCHQKLSTILDQVKRHTTTPLTYHEAVTLLERAEEAMKKAEDAQEKLIIQCQDDDAFLVQQQAFEPTEEVYQEMKSKLREITSTLQPASSSTTTPCAPAVRVNLPPIQPPVFDGDFASWPSFKDLFVATIESNPHLTPAQKLQYLKASLQNEPATLIKSFIITDQNYQEAWNLLKERYDNDREIIHSLINKLINHKPLSTESPVDLQKLIDNASECSRALKVLKQPTEQWDSFLVVLHVNKLDSATRREWAIRQTGTGLPTFQEFTTFVSNHIRGLLATRAGSFTTEKTTKGDRSLKTHHTSTEQHTQQCTICNKGNHLHFKCNEFLSKSPSERSALARKLRMCYNCLKRDHQKQNCKSTSTCKKCGRKHHTLLHVDHPQAPHGVPAPVAPPGPPGPPAPPGCPPVQQTGSLIGGHASIETQVLLWTAVVQAKDHFGVLQPCRIFIDSGSQGTFITEACVTRLKLKRDRSRVTVTGLASTPVGTTRGKVNLTLYNSNNHAKCITIGAHILTQVTAPLPKVKRQVEMWPHLEGLELADPTYNEPGAIDILIGVEFIGQVLAGGLRLGPPNTPTALNTLFGWVLSGRVAVSDTQQIQTFHVMEDIDNVIRRFWEVEEPPTARILTTEERLCEEHFTTHCSRDETGRYVVAVPFNDQKKYLGASRDMAIRRLQQVERRLQRQPEHQQQYLKFMQEYEVLGHMEKIPDSEKPEVTGYTNYLPHHFVVNENSTTTSLRVVFDGSANTTSGVSFNSTQLVGATVQDDLYDLLLRFRLYPIVLKADIAKMFRQFKLRPEDAEFHRIVWRETPDQPISDYRLLTVTYGTACAPFLATRSLQQLALDCKEDYPAASKALYEDAYVDDILTGKNTTAEALQLVTELTEAVKQAGMELRKWSSNDKEVLSAIPESQRETDPHSFDSDQSIKALGVCWSPTTDEFIFKAIKPNDYEVLTKRVLLSELSRVFDPLGFLSVVTIRAKMLLQETWKLAIGWDDAVPQNIQQQWEEYLQGSQKLTTLSIPRRITSSSANKYELHGFCDASEKAYGCVVYLRALQEDGSVSVSFVTSKTRVAPLKQVTLPRLELCGAGLLAELIVRVQTTLQLDCALMCWCDSTIALRWIASPPKRWKTYVANRVAAIQELTPVEVWRHVPGKENPADLASRGASVEVLNENGFWYSGPSWLSEPNLPIFTTAAVAHEDLEERRLPVLTHHIQIENSIMERFSSLARLVRVTARILRLFHNAKKCNQHNQFNGPLTTRELINSQRLWIRHTQALHFRSEITCLQNGKPVASNSRLQQLYPYLDIDGILRVSGRLQNSNLLEERKHQVILPSNCHFTEMLVESIHHRHLHSGFSMTWSALQTEYWIIGGRDRVRHLIRKCVVCRKHRAETAQQLMGNLPTPRVTPSRPFLHTGVDYAGPFILKNPVGRVPKTYKGYMCLFVCMSTKAVYLEAVEGLSTDDFIEALRRFVSRRGLCAHMYSDCGTNFVGADRELRNLLTSSDHNSKLSEEATSHGITWHFNPPSAPHHGGLWEAAVKSAKYHLRRVLSNAILTYSRFSTILCQVEAVLNSRPLYPISSDPTDLNVLTPGHFLIGEPLKAVPDADLKKIKVNRLTQFQLLQLRVQHFWQRWSQEYLNTLQQRNKWRWEKDGVQVGDVVLIKEDSSPGSWRIARVIQVHPGPDGLVRVVTVKTSTSQFQRPIVKLIPLFSTENSD